MTPPTTIMMSARPTLSSSATSSGTSVRWPAASDDTPTMCTSFSTAWRAVSAGVEQRADVHVEAEVGERRRRSPSGRGRGRPGPSWRPGCAGGGRRPARRPRPCAGPARRPCASVAASAAVDARTARTSASWRPNTFSRASRDLADRGLGARGVDRQLEQVAVAGARRWSSASSAAAHRRRRRARPCRRSSLAIWLLAHGGVVDLQHRDLVLAGRAVLVDADDASAGRSRCGPGCGRRPPRCAAWACRPRSPWPCRPAPRPRRCAASARARQVGGQPLDVVAAAPRVDDPVRCRSPAAGRAGCCGRCGPRNPSAEPGPRPGSWCAGTGCWPCAAAIASTAGARRRC